MVQMVQAWTQEGKSLTAPISYELKSSLIFMHLIWEAFLQICPVEVCEMWLVKCWKGVEIDFRLKFRSDVPNFKRFRKQQYRPSQIVPTARPKSATGSSSGKGQVLLILNLILNLQDHLADLGSNDNSVILINFFSILNSSGPIRTLL